MVSTLQSVYQSLCHYNPKEYCPRHHSSLGPVISCVQIHHMRARRRSDHVFPVAHWTAIPNISIGAFLL